MQLSASIGPPLKFLQARSPSQDPHLIAILVPLQASFPMHFGEQLVGLDDGTRLGNLLGMPVDGVEEG